jgi:hypothetical protein
VPDIKKQAPNCAALIPMGTVRTSIRKTCETRFNADRNRFAKSQILNLFACSSLDLDVAFVLDIVLTV